MFGADIKTRYWCRLFAVFCYPVCDFASYMVVSFHYLSWACYYQYGHPFGRVQGKRSRQSVCTLPPFQISGMDVYNILSLVACLQSVGEEIVEAGTSEHSKYRQMFNQKNLHLLAFFSLVYVGIEFTIACKRPSLTYLHHHCWFY